MNDKVEYLKKYLKKGTLEEALQKLQKGEPVQYIVGNVNFYGNELIVNKNVLIPRFETEELVEKTSFYIRKYGFEDASLLDMGTGSGAIAITLKKMFPTLKVTASDISSKALSVARENAKKNDVSISFLESDLFENINGTFDILISNPPYLSYGEEVMEMVHNNEPHEALYAKENGFYFYKQIIQKASLYLKNKNILAFEIGSAQGSTIKKYAQRYFSHAIIEIQKDLSGRERFLFIINL